MFGFALSTKVCSNSAPTENERLNEGPSESVYHHNNAHGSHSEHSESDNKSAINVRCLDPLERRLRHIQEKVFRSRGPITDQIKLHYPEVTRIMNELAALCDDERERLTNGVVNPNDEQAAKWREWIKQARAHPIAELIWDGDIIARLAYNNGRGHRGDARVLDLVYYGPNQGDMEQQPRWTQVFTAINHKHPSQVATQRCIWIGRFIDGLAEERKSSKTSPLRVLSINCGHLREMTYCEAFLDGRVVVTALDSDPEAIDLTHHEYAQRLCLPVIAKCVPMQSLLLRHHELLFGLGKFDAIYTSTEHMPDDVSSSLISVLFDNLLAPAGVLQVSNITPAMPVRGYDEVFEDWHFHARDGSDMEKLTSEIRPGSMSYKSIGHHSIMYVYLSIQKALNPPLQKLSIFEHDTDLLKSKVMDFEPTIKSKL